MTTRKILFFILIISLVGVNIFFSCTKEDSDNEAPTMEIFNIKEGDTIYTDSVYGFKARFSDDKALSSYSIKIWNSLLESETDTFTLKSTLYSSRDSILPKESDSALFNRPFQYANIFGSKDTTIIVNNGFNVDSLLNGAQISLTPHWFKVTVMDLLGNKTVDSFLVNMKLKPRPKPIMPPEE